MRTVERWWNGRVGVMPGDELRRDVRLLSDGELWAVEIRAGGPDGESWRSDEGNEMWARRMLAAAMDGDGWRRVG